MLALQIAREFALEINIGSMGIQIQSDTARANKGTPFQPLLLHPTTSTTESIGKEQSRKKH